MCLPKLTGDSGTGIRTVSKQSSMTPEIQTKQNKKPMCCGTIEKAKLNVPRRIGGDFTKMESIRWVLKNECKFAGWKAGNYRQWGQHGHRVIDQEKNTLIKQF